MSSIEVMKVSVSLPEDDVSFVDRYAEETGTSRSGALQEAVQLLRRRDLTAQYDAAHEEWTDSGEAAVWNATSGDGLR